jgi:hypothetical protein
MLETDIPNATVDGAGPQVWVERAAQLIDVLLNRLNRPEPAPRVVDVPARALRATDERLVRRCRFLSRRNGRLASALAACGCWGLNPRCSRCGGEGRPGTFELDPEAFAELVVPFLLARPEVLAWVAAHPSGTAPSVSHEPEQEQ